MTIKIVYTNDIRCDSLEQLVPLLSEERRQSLNNVNERAAVELIMTELLIRREASRSLGVPFRELHFGYGEHGKPCIADALGYSFSVSHSGGCIAFAESAEDIGVDVQSRQGGKRFAARFFTENERQYAQLGDCEFFEVWTRKEAYVKMLGTGISLGFRNFDVLNGSLDCSFITEQLPQHTLSVCSKISKSTESLCTEEIDKNTLINTALSYLRTH